MTSLYLLMREYSPVPSGKGVDRGSQNAVSSHSPGLNKKNRGYHPNEQGVVVIELNNIQKN